MDNGNSIPGAEKYETDEELTDENWKVLKKMGLSPEDLK